MKPAREPASSRPKPCASLKKPQESCPFAAPCGPRRKKNDRGPTSAFPSETSRFKPAILTHRGSALPWPLDDQATLGLRRIWCVPTRYYQALRDSAPCLLCAATLPKGTKSELGRGAHLGTPSSANHTAAASQSSSIAKVASWLHLLRMSPALHPPERPSHTHTPKPGLYLVETCSFYKLPAKTCEVFSSTLTG